ncbi:restriction endonuclease [Butyrivibrio sp. VCB2001]|uniref:restriction endonuclease n=1 Tax=Butyrivibrio sp. VCB2001 TaxID=1280667 RepID=UPI00041FB5A0|nr:restriction endonuclease [Butyrivibrio sp. VCB2001]
MSDLNKNIKINEANPIHEHSKASEVYIASVFNYEDAQVVWDGWLPIEYRRTGVSVDYNDKPALYTYMNKVYDQMNPGHLDKWNKDQDEFWSDRNARVTEEIFEALRDGEWKCVNHDLPSNPNFARRIQDLKEFGYTIATDTKRYCSHCGKNTTHLMMLHIPRVELAGNGYETWSPALRKRIINVLGGVDVYENVSSRNVLPDHKFSEIRWDDNTKSENPDKMTDEEIRSKFQLLTNQRNQQKREVCRNCYQTGQRGTIFGIDYFYKGDAHWDESIPKKGKDAEKGCEGCPWYDIQEWRRRLNEKNNR